MLTEIELRAYIGLLLLFGMTKKGDVEVNEIWVTDSIHHCDWASASMPRDKFKIITSYITFDDNSTRNIRASTSKYFKMNELFNIFRSNIKSALTPGKHLCVDEQLYSFRGHCKFRQYMPNKPAKYGLKYYSIVDVSTCYLLDSEIYLGKKTGDPVRAKNVGENVVKNLAEPYLYSNRIITADNFFSSVPLANFLYSKNTEYIGTLRANKAQIPLEFLPNKKEKLNLHYLASQAFYR